MSDEAPKGFTEHRVKVAEDLLSSERGVRDRMNWRVRCVCGWSEVGSKTYVHKAGYKHVSHASARAKAPTWHYGGPISLRAVRSFGGVVRTLCWRMVSGSTHARRVTAS